MQPDAQANRAAEIATRMVCTARRSTGRAATVDGVTSAFSSSGHSRSPVAAPEADGRQDPPERSERQPVPPLIPRPPPRRLHFATLHPRPRASRAAAAPRTSAVGTVSTKTPPAGASPAPSRASSPTLRAARRRRRGAGRRSRSGRRRRAREITCGVVLPRRRSASCRTRLLTTTRDPRLADRFCPSLRAT